MRFTETGGRDFDETRARTELVNRLAPGIAHARITSYNVCYTKLLRGKTIIMVEQNAKKGLEFADIGYVLVSGELALAGTGKELLENPEVGRLFLGG